MTWHSSLQLNFDYKATTLKTRLFHRLHAGALMIQRPLYPEPEPQHGICHVYVLYPPAGIADGDELDLIYNLKPDSHAVITTPGAGKWYGQRQSLRSDTVLHHNKDTRHSHQDSSNLTASDVTNQSINPLTTSSPLNKVSAQQHITATIASDAILEWLPQESIYYDYSVSKAVNRFHLDATASLLTWDIAVFGRQAYQEQFKHGHYSNRLEIWRDDTLLVSEHTTQKANSRWFSSPLGLNNHHVHGSFWLIPSSRMLDSKLQDNPIKLGQYLDNVLAKIRALIDEQALPIVCTHNYQGINCRYLGADVRSCFDAFYKVRELIRALWYKLEPHRPRIWDT